MEPNTTNESIRVEEGTDKIEQTSGTSDESDYVDEDYARHGTKREFTISSEQWDVFINKMNSTNLVTEWMPHLFVRTSANEIGGRQMLQTCYWDELGTRWRGAPWPATERLVPLELKAQQRGTRFECTNANGPGTITIYSPNDDEMDGQYWTRKVLGKIENNDYEFSRSNRAIPRCVRQLKVNTLEEMTHFFKTDLLSTLACFCRNLLPTLNLKGHVSHLFIPQLGDPNESVFVAPISRGQLGGVTLIQMDGTDYSLKTGKRVGYKRVRDVFEVVTEGWCLERIDDDALVG